MDNKPTILIVEDESTIRAAFADMVSAGGYRCIAAANAVDAMHIIEADILTFDMLITDIVMPGELNGVELADKLRERQPNVAVLLVTAYAQSAIKEAAEARGYRVLEKPFRQATFAAAIAEELASRATAYEGPVIALESVRHKRLKHS